MILNWRTEKVNEKNRLPGSTLGRQQGEFYGPMVHHLALERLLNRQGLGLSVIDRSAQPQ